MEYTQQELEEMVTGRPADPHVTFFEKAILNVEKSREAQRRIYDTHTFIQKRYPGVTDYVPEIATKQDLKRYAVEYANFKATEPGASSPAVEIIPNLTMAEKQELRDIGIRNIKQLAEANTVPLHLSHAQKMARVIYAAMEQNDAEERSSTGEAVQENGPAPLGQDNRHDVGQPRPSAGGGNGSQRQTPQRVQADRPVHNYQGLSPEFSLEVTFS